MMNCHLLDFLSDPDLNLLNHFYLCHPANIESYARVRPAMTQVNMFNCSVIVIGMCLLHKVLDSISTSAFLKGWAAFAWGCFETVHNAATLFPPNDQLLMDSLAILGRSMVKTENSVMRGVLFKSSAMATLKSKASGSGMTNPSLVEVATAFVWKCAMLSAQKANRGLQRPSVLSHAVDLRRRMVPPLQEYSIGNLLWILCTKCKADNEIVLHSPIRKLRETITEIYGDFVERLQSGQGLCLVAKSVKEMCKLCSEGPADYYGFTTWSKFGMYDTDFEWGKHVWVRGHRIVGLGNLVHTLETREGDGMENLDHLGFKIEKLFKDEATERARMASFVGAMAIADLVKTTLGPKGMTGGGHNVTVTNDGATILKSLHIDNPAAKVLVGISKVQDDEVGDGTTSVVVLAGELLREAERLLATNIHPMTIISGYRMAAECARYALLQKVMDNKEDAEKFKEDLMKIAMTTLSSKMLSQDEEHFANLAVDAVMRLQGSTNLEAIKIIKNPGGSLKDSWFCVCGGIAKKVQYPLKLCATKFTFCEYTREKNNSRVQITFAFPSLFVSNQKKRIGIGPKHIENAKILVANTAMDADKVKIYGACVRVDSMSRVAEIEGAEKEQMREKVQKIIALGINCFVNRQLIYNFLEELFADAGILAIEHADFDGIEHLALVTGGEIASTFASSLRKLWCKTVNDSRVLLGGG
ncbi:unnamed protein product [Camellia sinensis]